MSDSPLNLSVTDTNSEKIIFNLLKNTALEDGIMKLEETQLISHAMRSAIAFDWYLREARKDGVITEEERNKLEELKNRIYNNAKEIAEADNEITKDEAKLLAKLSSELDKLEEFNPD